MSAASNGTVPPRPVPLRVRFENIAPELLEGVRGVLWRYELRDGEWTKPPYQVNGKKASSTNQATWSDFTTIRAAYEAGGWDGIGRIHLPEDNLLGADADHCVDAATGAISGEAAEAVLGLRSYTEFSVSGEGLRGFCFGRKPGRRCRVGNLELYDGITAEGKPGGRYLTLTGHTVPGSPTSVMYRQDEVTALYNRLIPPESEATETPDRPPLDLGDEELLAVALGAKNGAKIKALWDGDTSRYKSPSEADCALCSHLAFYCGPDRERIDRMFRSSSLYRSKWDRADYRDRTIARALKGKTEFYQPSQRLHGFVGKAVGRTREAGNTPEPPQQDDGQGDGSGSGDNRHGEGEAKKPRLFTNFFELPGGDGKKKKIGLPVTQLLEDLNGLTDGWPRRAGELLFVEGPEYQPLWIGNQEAMLAWLGRKIGGGAPVNPIQWAEGVGKVGKSELFAAVHQACERYEAVEPLPHEPPVGKHFYYHAPLKGGDGKALAEFLGRFSPSSPVDADLIKAATLTPFWGGPPGQRPAFLFEMEGDDPRGGRGGGKTKISQAIAHLGGGHIDARCGEDFDKLLTRLLSPAALGRRVVLLDNVKSLKFSWGDLEALLTADIVSGRQLYVGEGQRPNLLTWFITLNCARLSKDLAQRTVIIRLKRPAYDPAWEADTWALINARRQEIVGDIVAELRRDAPKLGRFSRWSLWEDAVLSRVGDPAACQLAVEQRQAEVDEDREEADIVRDGFVEALRRFRHDPDAAAVWISSRLVAMIVNKATGEARAVNKAVAYLATLHIAELRRSDRGHGKGWLWRGARAGPFAPTMVLGADEAWI